MNSVIYDDFFGDLIEIAEELKELDEELKD